MVILETCCCWDSVRKGSFASGIYTMIYFSLTTFILEVTFINDVEFVKENTTTADQKYTINLISGISYATMVFYIVLVVLSGLGIIASMILIIGLFINNRFLLIPWMVMVVVVSIADVTHSIYWLTLDVVSTVHAPLFNPISAIFFTLELFIFVLNVYALLCVISQFQEYKAGRGTSDYDRIMNTIPDIRYSLQPTTGSVSTGTKRTILSPNNQSPSAKSSITTGRRHVQFPQDPALDLERSDFFWCEESKFANESPSNGDSEEPNAEYIKIEVEDIVKWQNRTNINDNVPPGAMMTVSDGSSINITSETSTTNTPLKTIAVTKL